MTNGSAQIVSAFEELKLSPAEIAEQFGYDEVAVKSILMQYSREFKKALGEDKKLGFNDEQEQSCIDVITNIAKGYLGDPDDINIRLRAAMFIRNDRQGRLDPIKNSSSLNINILNFNEDLKKALAAKERSKQQVIDIPSEVKALDPLIRRKELELEEVNS